MEEERSESCRGDQRPLNRGIATTREGATPGKGEGSKAGALLAPSICLLTCVVATSCLRRPQPTQARLFNTVSIASSIRLSHQTNINPELALRVPGSGLILSNTPIRCRIRQTLSSTAPQHVLAPLGRPSQGRRL